MLTVRPPIELKLNPALSNRTDNFCERIEGNYRLMLATLQPEDLMHMVSQPAEVYLGEGGMTNLVNTTGVYNNQEINLEVINNVMNRVLMSDTYRMTYQDQVFISAVLRRLGVTNLQEFMNRLISMKEETRSRNELTDLYWNHIEQLQQLSESYYLEQKGGRSTEPEPEEADRQDVLTLHQEIFNRLRTGAVYEEVKNYLTSAHTQNRIYPAEMQVGEQTVTAQNIFLNKLKNVTADREEPLVYNRINTYELGDVVNLEENESRTVQELNQAVLLNVLDQMYALRFRQIFGKKDLWYRLEGALYQSAENTIRRFEHYHNQTSWSRQDARSYADTVNHYHRQEIQTLNRIFPELERELVNRESMQTVRTEGGMPGEAQTLLLPGQERLIAETQREYLQEESVLESSDTERILDGEILLKRELDRINEQNIRNREKLQQLSSREVSQSRIMIDRQQARRDALRALERPEEVVMEYLTSESRLESIRKEEEEAVTSLFSEETKQIFSELEHFRRIPETAGAAGMTDRAQAQLERDVRFHVLKEQNTVLEEQEHTAQELVHEVRKDVQEQVERAVPGMTTRQERRSAYDRLELVHKSQEQTLTEEFLDELEVRAQLNRTRTETKEEHIVTEHVQEREVQQVFREMKVNQSEEIARLVNQNLQQQIGRLSDQVYGRLEKRLDGERRRRGM